MISKQDWKQYNSLLQTECSQCKGLCCKLLYCFKQDGFPEDKEAMVACKYLTTTNICTIHSNLHKQNLFGCMRYDCGGAGNHISNLANHASIKPDDFMKMVELHQILQYLLAAFSYYEDEEQQNMILTLIQTWQDCMHCYDSFQAFDLTMYHQDINVVLKDMIKQIHKKYAASLPALGRELIGKDLRKYTLQGADFSMKYMMASNISSMNLQDAVFLGSDVRDVNVCDSDLSHVHFLTQMQVNAMKGNENTQLPNHLQRPKHWD